MAFTDKLNSFLTGAVEGVQSGVEMGQGIADRRKATQQEEENRITNLYASNQIAALKQAKTSKLVGPTFLDTLTSRSVGDSSAVSSSILGEAKQFQPSTDNIDMTNHDELTKAQEKAQSKSQGISQLIGKVDATRVGGTELIKQLKATQERLDTRSSNYGQLANTVKNLYRFDVTNPMEDPITVQNHYDNLGNIYTSMGFTPEEKQIRLANEDVLMSKKWKT